MNDAAMQLVKTSRSLIERWRTDAFEGDLELANLYVERMADALHRIGLSPTEIDRSFAPSRQVVGLEGLSNAVMLVGTAVVASLEGIRHELRLKRGGYDRTDSRHRQAALDLAVNDLANLSDGRQQAALDV